jgi:hypothetical protein
LGRRRAQEDEEDLQPVQTEKQIFRHSGPINHI